MSNVDETPNSCLRRVIFQYSIITFIYLLVYVPLHSKNKLQKANEYSDLMHASISISQSINQNHQSSTCTL